MDESNLQARAAAVFQALKKARLRLVTAESCTGGWIAKCMTDLAGSSDVLDGGFVCYSNALKRSMLGVPGDLLDQFGAVSEPVVKAMAEGALVHTEADIAVAVSGVAGPGGGSVQKPVGTVWLAVGRRGSPVEVRLEWFPGDRQAVRMSTVASAFDLVLNSLD